MSANNQIRITETPSHFEISDIDVDTDSGFIIGKTKDLRRAIRLANEYQKDNECEYGIRFDLFK